jgi:hypothetical protein
VPQLWPNVARVGDIPLRGGRHESIPDISLTPAQWPAIIREVQRSFGGKGCGFKSTIPAPKSAVTT